MEESGVRGDNNDASSINKQKTKQQQWNLNGQNKTRDKNKTIL